MKTLFLKLRTYGKLGFLNVIRVFFYRFILLAGWGSAKTVSPFRPVAPFFDFRLGEYAGSVLHVELPGCDFCFSGFGLVSDFNISDSFPDWHRSFLTGELAPYLPWWEISDFSEGLGDVKGVWEQSRFDWVVVFARQVVAGERDALQRLNDWLSDWNDKNPPYVGVNWKCGQEASIRVMHLAMAAHLLGQISHPPSGLIKLLHVHLRRIAPTIQYAIAQDNNHGTSEAAALFIGGSWLLHEATDAQPRSEAKLWMKQGRKWLENRAQKLIEPDGSFSQYSLNYHRVMLDSYSMVEIWRRSLGLPDFSDALVERLKAATAWLGNMLSPDGADTPNLGANDGARLLPLAETDYRDVRPSVQLASVLFFGSRAYEGSGAWDDPLKWLRVAIPEQRINHLASRQYDDGGFAVLRDRLAMALIRYPRFQFRPGQSDLLHVDFWLGETNLLRDAGSYSYNCEEPWQSYFPGSAAHNTIQFDGRDAMPRLSRFLFGAWPKARDVVNLRNEDGKQEVAAGYRDWKGATHHRLLSLGEVSLRVTDDVAGFGSSAVLRWRLAPGKWSWEDDWLVGHGVRLRVTGTQSIIRCELVEGWESRYYSQKTPLPVLEVEVDKAGRLTTELRY